VIELAAALKGAGGRELEMARARAGLYGLVSRLFSGKPTVELLQGMKGAEMLESLAAFGVAFDEDFLVGDAEAQAGELTVEFARLFLATGSHIAPYESVFIRGWSEDKPQLWGEATVAVAKFYEEAGLELTSGQTPDHLGLELEAMAMLAECEAARRESGDTAGAELLEQLQDRFCREHLIQWVPEICEAVEQRTVSSFYRSVAVLTASLVRMHCGGSDLIIED
jgi:TorA maturation chaperone TorD